MRGREILYIHIERFYAEVEQMKRPGLAGRPMVVVEDRGRNRNVVSVSRSAYQLGIRRDMSLRHARQISSDIEVVKADHAAYIGVFNAALEICYCYSPVIEPDFPDGAWIDVTGCRAILGDAKTIAARIAFEVRGILGLDLAVGCGASKTIAKIASGAGRKLTIVEAGKEAEFLALLSMGFLDSVDRKLEKRFNDLGIATIGQLAQIPEAVLIRQLGKVASAIRRQSLGIDFSPVKAVYPPDTIICDRTFPTALDEPASVFNYLQEMTCDLGQSLKSRNRLAGGLRLTLYAESGLAAAVSEVYRFKRPTDSLYAINLTLEKLLSCEMKSGVQVSGAGIVLSGLTAGVSSQLTLVGTDTTRCRLDRTIEQINSRFGSGKICSAATLFQRQLPARNIV